jgi:hypothetical protein
MRAACGLLVAVVAVGAFAPACAEEGDGLTLPRLQARVKFGIGIDAAAIDSTGSSGSSARLSGASGLGDYYFGRYSIRAGEAGGFRATSGVLLGSQLGIWGGPSAASPIGSAFSVERHTFSLLSPARGVELAGQDSGTVPYLGLGYSGSSAKGGWGFSADLGLMALNPGNAVRLGRVLGGGPTLDDVLRDMRMSPLVQVGASYSF